MRVLAITLCLLVIGACARHSEAISSSASAETCYLNVSYVSGNELSRGVWAHLQTAQYDLLDSGDRAFQYAFWYTRGRGRAGFAYRLSCYDARLRVQDWLERFAESAPSPDIAQALRDAKHSIREVTREEFEDAGQ